MALDITQLIGSGGAVVLAVTAIQFLQKLRDNRAVRRMGLDQQFQTRYSGDVKWINAYRSCAERHGWWDQDMRMANIQKDVAINRLEEKLGMELTKFEPVPPAPPLFPQLDDSGDPITPG
jgi:hypothetical protein